MIICLDQRTDAGCGAENRDSAQHCGQCGRSLRFALALHNPGDLVGPYRIVRVLGHGGAGAVYEAEIVGRPELHVALKETLDPDSIRSFQNEFAVLHQLRHANLPRYFEMFELRGNGYLVMERIEGQSLQSLIDQQGGPLPEAQVLGYAAQICSVLEYLHGQRPPIIHRDIKPANIRLTPQGQIKLVDFGLLKQGGQRTRPTLRGIGTPAYAPPEQYSRDERHTDPRSDIYSLGATLYHLLTGQEPPPAPARAAVSPDPLLPLLHYQPKLSRGMADAVLSAMQLSQQNRFESVVLFRRALLAGSAVRPPQPPAARAQPRAVPVCVLHSAADRIIDIAWNYDSQTLASANSDCSVRLWDVVDGQMLHTLYGHPDVLTSVAYSSDGHFLATGSLDGRVCVWQTDRWELIATLPWRGERSASVAFSPRGPLLASGSVDGTINLWRIEDDGSHGLVIWPLKHDGGVRSIAWHPNGQVLASAGIEGTIYLWQAAQGAVTGKLNTSSGEVTSLAWSASGQVLAHAGADGAVVLVQLELRDPVRERSARFPNPTPRWLLADFAVLHILRGHSGRVQALAWHPEGRLLASSGGDRRVRLWRAADGALLQTLSGHSEEVESLAWSPNGRLLASAGRDRTVRVWAIDGE